MSGTKRATIFREFLEDNGYYIDYNGEHYTLVKDNEIVHIVHTPEEIYNFIMGYNLARKLDNDTILNLTEINKTNVERYEKIIEDMTKN